MNARFALAALAAILGAGSANSEEHVWLIGGGPFPDNSQAQIELNVGWVMEVLRARAPLARQHVYFTDGTDEGRDVKSWSKPVDAKPSLQPLARVFGTAVDNGIEFRSHRIPGVAGGTEAGPLKIRLAEEFSRLKEGDKALLVYNGHGLGDRKDAADHTLRLWKDTRLSARELESLLGRLPPSVPVRFVMTQCYAGGFSRLVRPGAADTVAIASANRCGFMAESESRESEGCSDSINIGDYRDYTTFFFAALNGRTRTGEPLAGNPDTNGDGVVSLYEAHLYVLGHADSSDLPRATSEVFLERWQPWYLRWLDTGAEPDNVYGRLARSVAGRQGLPPAGRPLVEELGRRRAAHAREFDGLLVEKQGLAEEAKRLQKRVQQDMRFRWPEALHPHTLAYARFLQRDLDAAQDFVLAHPAYRDLAAKQDRLEAIEREITRLDRQMTRLDQVRRLRVLARLLDQFERHASAKERGWYSRLLACEQLPL